MGELADAAPGLDFLRVVKLFAHHLHVIVLGILLVWPLHIVLYLDFVELPWS
jgi:hypothetical protein